MIPRNSYYDMMMRDSGRGYGMHGDMRGDYGYDMARRYGDRERSSRMGDSSPERYYDERNGRGYERGGQSDRGSIYPFDVRGMFGRYDACGYEPYQGDFDMARRRHDYGDVTYLPREVLDRWIRDLMDELDEKDKPVFKMENIVKRAKDMGVEFERFTEDEFLATTLMVVTDYCKTLGMSNIDLYLKLAKDWLQDKDSALKGSEKLAAYYYSVIKGM